MARTRKADIEQRPFILRDNPAEVSSRSPRGKAMQSKDPSYIGYTLSELRKAVKMPRVTSNSELVERIDSYLQLCENRSILPTVEEISLYCGYSPATWRDWRTGRNGFSDTVQYGSTSTIVKRYSAVLAALDQAAVHAGDLNPVWAIFRLCNYHPTEYTQRNTLTVNAAPVEEQHIMTLSEIE